MWVLGLKFCITEAVAGACMPPHCLKGALQATNSETPAHVTLSVSRVQPARGCLVTPSTANRVSYEAETRILNYFIVGHPSTCVGIMGGE